MESERLACETSRNMLSGNPLVDIIVLTREREKGNVRSGAKTDQLMGMNVDWGSLGGHHVEIDVHQPCGRGNSQRHGYIHELAAPIASSHACRPHVAWWSTKPKIPEPSLNLPMNSNPLKSHWWTQIRVPYSNSYPLGTGHRSQASCPRIDSQWGKSTVPLAKLCTNR